MKQMRRLEKKWLIVAIAAYIVVRIYVATLSSYGFYHGWNEGWYSLIAKNYFSGSLWEQIAYGDEPFSSVPPFFSYAVYASFKVLGISDINARLISILAEIIAVLGVYILAKELYYEKTASIAVLIFIFLPWNILWFGRVQTDPLMTALMTLAIALYVHAYKNDESMLPFGIIFGLAVFTKQPALAALPIVLMWSYFQGIKKMQILKAIFYSLLGLTPLFVWLLHYLIGGDVAFVSHFIYGELAHRSTPFSDIVKVSAITIVGISPLVLLTAFYEISKMKNYMISPLIIWLLFFGAFVLIRTPPSHEYYSLPLMPVFAIFAAKSTERFTRATLPLVVGVLLFSMIITSYVLLSYTGDIGYTATKDAGNYINMYTEQHPQDTLLVVTPSRYVPQMVWYANLTTQNRQVYTISNNLATVAIADIEKIINTTNATAIFLVIDDREGLMERISDKYMLVYSSRYETWLPNIAGLYTKELQSASKFEQKLAVFRLI